MTIGRETMIEKAGYHLECAKSGDGLAAVHVDIIKCLLEDIDASPREIGTSNKKLRELLLEES